MSIFPDVLIYEEGKLLQRNGGWLLSKTEWEKIKMVMDEFYLFQNDDSIEKINKDHAEEIEERYRLERESERNKPKKKKHKKPGCVYFIGCEETGVKIGFSTNVEGRLKTLNIASPYKLKLIEKIDCGNYEQVEKWAHEYFAPRRMNSEWFDITEKEIKDWIGGLTRG